jgi:predicted NUDIX family NTP pyrophosphohydrolase
MSNEYAYRAAKADDVHSGGITFLQRSDGAWAVPGGGYIVNRRHAVKAAENLFKSNPNVQSLISTLVNKTVERLEGV